MHVRIYASTVDVKNVLTGAYRPTQLTQAIGKPINVYTVWASYDNATGPYWGSRFRNREEFIFLVVTVAYQILKFDKNVRGLLYVYIDFVVLSSSCDSTFTIRRPFNV